MARFDWIAFDADDTLWHTERMYVDAQAKFGQLLAQYHSPEWIAGRLYQTETRNLQHFGYGVKAFILSMIETSVELTEGRISAAEIKALIDTGRAMLTADLDLLDYAAETVAALAERYPLMVITKGDLLDQESKIERSGLSRYFRLVEIVSAKTRASYARLLERHEIDPQRFLMIGNSLRSDILPVLEIGGQAVYVPYALTWAHESGDAPQDMPGFHQVDHLGQLPALLEKMEAE